MGSPTMIRQDVIDGGRFEPATGRSRGVDPRLYEVAKSRERELLPNTSISVFPTVKTDADAY